MQMEKRSARIIALILALIMIGSVFAYMMRGNSPEKRKVVLKLNDFREYVNITPKGAYYFQYVNFQSLGQFTKDNPLKQYVDNKLDNILVPTIFSRSVLEVTRGIYSVFEATYGPGISLYFVDANQSRVFFAKKGEFKYHNFTIQYFGNIALMDQTSPFVVGYAPLVMKVVDVIQKRNESVGKDIYKYLARINGSFVYADFMYGNIVKMAMKSNNTSIADFFFEGFRYNATDGLYEKVWAIHFLGNYFFAAMNKSEQNFAYYTFKNYPDGLSVAVMGDKDFTKVLYAKPRILAWKIILTKNEGKKR